MSDVYPKEIKNIRELVEESGKGIMLMLGFRKRRNRNGFFKTAIY
jgi:hypothetical protein